MKREIEAYQWHAASDGRGDFEEAMIHLLAAVWDGKMCSYIVSGDDAQGVGGRNEPCLYRSPEMVEGCDIQHERLHEFVQTILEDLLPSVTDEEAEYGMRRIESISVENDGEKILLETANSAGCHYLVTISPGK